jgi:hypothetical protein
VRVQGGIVVVMSYIPFGIAQELVADHQRELQSQVARWRRRARHARLELPVSVPPATPLAPVSARPATDGERNTPAAA